MRPVTVAGVDLGASSGRVIAAHVSKDGVELHQVSRFVNEPVLAGALREPGLRIPGERLPVERGGVNVPGASGPLDDGLDGLDQLPSIVGV